MLAESGTRNKITNYSTSNESITSSDQNATNFDEQQNNELNETQSRIRRSKRMMNCKEGIYCTISIELTSN